MSSRGAQYFADAEKVLKKFSIFDKNGKFSDAADLFMKAGNAYKSIRDFNNAGESYSRAGDCFQHINSLNEAASAYADSGKMFAKDEANRQKAISAFDRAQRMYRENSKPLNAARLMEEAAKLFQDNNDLDSAIQSLSDAAQIYEDEGSIQQSLNVLVQVADHKATQQKWIEAAQLYKDIALKKMDDRLTALLASEFCTKAILCQLAAGDFVGAKIYIDNFLAKNPSWDRSHEFNMIQTLIKAIEETKPDDFAQAVYDYDQIKRLDNWMTSTLLLIKKQIEVNEEEDSIL